MQSGVTRQLLDRTDTLAEAALNMQYEHTDDAPGEPGLASRFGPVQSLVLPRDCAVPSFPLL